MWGPHLRPMVDGLSVGMSAGHPEVTALVGLIGGHDFGRHTLVSENGDESHVNGLATYRPSYCLQSELYWFTEGHGDSIEASMVAFTLVPCHVHARRVFDPPSIVSA